MIDLLVVAAMLLAALGLGRPSARLIGLRMSGRLEALIFNTALGWVGLVGKLPDPGQQPFAHLF